MITAGVDIGSSSNKIVLMDDRGILDLYIAPSYLEFQSQSEDGYLQLLEKNNLRLQDVYAVVATGYGRRSVQYADKCITEISCHARGANWSNPEIRTILDMGGQDCKAIICDEKGKLVNFAMNEKCAAGTGRYLERMAKLTKVPIDRISDVARESEDPRSLSSLCLVYAEQNAERMLMQGVPVPDILAGACQHIVNNITQLLNKVGGVQEQFCVSGGVAQNSYLTKLLEKELQIKVAAIPNPQFNGAIGAARFARELKKIRIRE